MAIYGISDLHLSAAKPKPMDIFGDVWADHAERVRDSWTSTVGEGDTVLMPGDLSWAMRPSEARPDLEFVRKLPGRKILVRGNHDYWWQRRATSHLQQTLGGRMILLQGTSTIVDSSVAVAGTRGWRIEREVYGGMGGGAGEERNADPDKVLRRELAYLENGLQSMPSDARVRIAMLHYPPFDEKLEPNAFAELLTRYRVDILVYGHVHLGAANWIDGMVSGVQYHIVSADVIGFIPKLIIP